MQSLLWELKLLMEERLNWQLRECWVKYMFKWATFSAAQEHLTAVLNGAAAAGVSLQANFADIFGVDNDLNSEINFCYANIQFYF